jgi:HAD superfamily hydrolase (TIGR01549 family)
MELITLFKIKNEIRFMAKLRVDGIALDYGNTLVLDPFDRVMEIKAFDFRKIMEANGYEVSRKKLVETWKDANLTVNYPFCSHFSQEIPIIAEMLERLGIRRKDVRRIAQNLLVSYREGYKGVLKKDRRLESVKEVLGTLKNMGKKLILLSNDRMDTAKSVFSWTGLDMYFEKIIISESMGMEKPDTRLFMYMVKMMGFEKERILYVGDDPERDIRPSKELGIKAVMFRDPSALSVPGWRDYDVKFDKKHKPDAVIIDLSQLLEMIE